MASSYLNCRIGPWLKSRFACSCLKKLAQPTSMQPLCVTVLCRRWLLSLKSQLTSYSTCEQRPLYAQQQARENRGFGHRTVYIVVTSELVQCFEQVASGTARCTLCILFCGLLRSGSALAQSKTISDAGLYSVNLRMQTDLKTIPRVGGRTSLFGCANAFEAIFVGCSSPRC